MRVLRVARLLGLLLLSAAASAQQVRLDTWQFLADASGSLAISNLPASGWREARAGLSWQAQFGDLRNYSGAAWYRTVIDVPAFDTPRHVLLRFGAVDYLAEVFVNGRSAGRHEGGYTPFVFDITAHVHPGRNDVAVRVLDVADKQETGGIRYDEIPHGKQNWYVQTSGLWQPVTLEFRPSLYIERLQVTPRITGEVMLAVMITGAPTAGASLQVTVRDRNGGELIAVTQPVGDKKEYSATVQVRSPEFWSPDHPALYAAEAKLLGGIPDTVRVRFGFRSLDAKGGRLYLNGAPFYMIGALDQDFYPDTIYSAPSPGYVRREMEEAKKLGLNTLRCHIKVCPPEYLDAADEAGLVVWYEIPNWDHFSAGSAERGERTLQEMVARDWIHPSILIQSIINESWGVDLNKGEQRRWLRTMYDRARTLTAPLGRLIVDNSPCCENFHLRTDLNDFHQYYSIPDNAAHWDRWVADFAARPKWTFSPYGDGEPTGDEPLIVSEFGNWGLPPLPAALPWWFKREAGSEITQPDGVRERFRQYRFERLFRTYDELAAATQWHQFLSLKHEIQEMRRYPSVQGYVITEFTDLNWESNGLLDMWRRPKVYAPELRQIQQPDVVFARLPRHSYRAGEQVTAELVVSHFSRFDLRGAGVYWWTDSGARGDFVIDASLNPATVKTTTISFAASVVLSAAAAPPPEPEPMKPGRDRLFLELRNREGELLATNSDEFLVYPPPSKALRTAVSVSPGDTLTTALKAGGYTTSLTATRGTVLIARRWDDRVAALLRDGGRVVLLVDSADALPSNLPVKVQARTGDFDGNWISNFAWVLPYASPFQNTGASPILGWEASEVTPHFVLRGVDDNHYDDVLAGMFYGWINLNSPLLIQARVGRGALLLTTFRFDRYGDDPFATALLDGILRYAALPQLAPRLELLP